MSVLVNQGAGPHAHNQQQTYKHAECVHMSLVAVPALGSLLMLVDCTLEPLGVEPHGSVCPAHQVAFTEVVVTAVIPTLRDRLCEHTGSVEFTLLIKEHLSIGKHFFFHCHSYDKPIDWQLCGEF